MNPQKILIVLLIQGFPPSLGCSPVDGAIFDDQAASDAGAAASDGAGVTTTNATTAATTNATTDSVDSEGVSPGCLMGDLALVLTGERVPGDLDLGLATEPETVRVPCGTPDEQACFHLVNDERAIQNLAPLIWDGDLADLGRSHAEDRLQQTYPGTAHGSSTDGKYDLAWKRAAFLGIESEFYGDLGYKFGRVREVATGGSPAEAIEAAMAYAASRVYLLGADTYLGCGAHANIIHLEFGHPTPWD
jgi:hypothetical protein